MHRTALALAALALPFAAQAQSDAPQDDLVARGEYLVTIGGCNDCHTPLKMGDNGPEPDMERMLSGHPAEIVIEGPATLQAPWASAGNVTNTAWSGPWGVSFTANLTPDPETGVLRDMPLELFVATMRTGRHQGQGRAILPPMPWFNYGAATDEDLAAIYAYLQQIPPVTNAVPAPLPPAQ